MLSKIKIDFPLFTYTFKKRELKPGKKESLTTTKKLLKIKSMLRLLTYFSVKPVNNIFKQVIMNVGIRKKIIKSFL